MKRRDLLAGIAAQAAAPQAPPATTIYMPPAHRVEDQALLHDTMDEYPFVELITAAPNLRITHLPVWLDRKAGPHGALFGHIARHNPQSELIDGHTQAVIVFRGPHGYISPSWFSEKRTVPTWNFAAVHVTGKPEPVTDPAALHRLLATLISRLEARYGDPGAYDFASLPASFVNGLASGIVGFRMAIDSIEGKFKLGQERSDAARATTVRRLEASATRERSMAAFTAAFYSRPK
jgi:transcriptional regulator